jgi:hypothetical protein
MSMSSILNTSNLSSLFSEQLSKSGMSALKMVDNFPSRWVKFAEHKQEEFLSLTIVNCSVQLGSTRFLGKH